LRLLLDEMYAPTIASQLRLRGHDVVSFHELGDLLVTGASDADVLVAAQREERTLVTENVRDYRPLESALLADGSPHAGVVYTSNRQFPLAIRRRRDGSSERSTRFSAPPRTSATARSS